MNDEKLIEYLLMEISGALVIWARLVKRWRSDGDRWWRYQCCKCEMTWLVRDQIEVFEDERAVAA